MMMMVISKAEAEIYILEIAIVPWILDDDYILGSPLDLKFSITRGCADADPTLLQYNLRLLWPLLFPSRRMKMIYSYLNS